MNTSRDRITQKLKKPRLDVTPEMLATKWLQRPVVELVVVSPQDRRRER